MSLSISGISPFCQTIMSEKLSCSTEQLWKRYDSSPVKNNTAQEDSARDRVLQILKKFTKHLKNDLAVGVIVYCEDGNVYAAYVNVDQTEKRELGDLQFYKEFLEHRVLSVLKQDEQIKNLGYFNSFIFSFNEQVNFYEIFKLNEPTSNIRPSEKLDCDFELITGKYKLPVNSQALIQNGGNVMSALVSCALTQKSNTLHLTGISLKVLKDYKKFISVTESHFRSHMAERTMDDVTNLYSFAKECDCISLVEECDTLLSEKTENFYMTVLSK